MILVTGGGGFIGSRVCRLLCSKKLDVVALDRSFAATPPCTRVQGDVSCADFLAELFHAYSFDSVVHLASVLNTASCRHPDEALRINMGGSLDLLQLAIQFEVKNFVYGSSISVYGEKCYEDYGEVSESEPASPSNVYGVSKRFVEIVGEQYRQQGLLQFAALRISIVVGPGATNTSSPWRSQIFEQLSARQPTLIHLPFARDKIIPVIHVEDVAEAIGRLIEASRPRFAIYNTPSENWRCNDLADYIRKLNRNVELAFSASTGRGDPDAILGSRFLAEFDFNPVPLKERLRLAAGNMQPA